MPKDPICRARAALEWALETVRRIRPIYLATAAVAAVAQALLVYVDAYEAFYAYSRSYEDWEIDELFTSFIVLTFVLLAIVLIRARDLTREAKHRAAAEMRLSMAIKHMRQGLAMFDGDQRIVVCNERYAEMYGLPSDLVVKGATLEQVLAARDASAHPARTVPHEHYRELARLVQDKEAWTQIRELADGRAIYVAHEPMADGGWVSTHDDITERRRIEERLAYLAHHDALTGLPNRLCLRQELSQALERAERGEGFALLSLDLDQFKEVNDRFGHPIGDALLKQVAHRLRGCVRDGDVVARMGGDEFAIIQVAAGQPTDATVLACRVIEQLTSSPFDVGDHQLALGTSIGIAVAPLDGTDPDLMLKCADLALYQAKAEGRGSYRFFEPEMNERMQARHKLELELRKGLAEGRFELYYQPLFDLVRNEVEGYEALLRWHHPERGMIPPAEFIPLAEETGLIGPIGEWVLREACTTAAKWPGRLAVAVNLSPIQFKTQGLVAAVVSALSASGLEPGRLELELTETALLQDNEGTLATLHKLRSLGIRIAMDDFGTGYSSLGYVQSFPFDKIKIDRRFITGLNNEAKSLAILRAISNLGASLGVATTAEGVETEDQLERVRAEGITEVQGFLIGHPMPARDIAAQLLSVPAKQSEVA